MLLRKLNAKGGRRAVRDFDLLDGGDSFGVTISGDENQMRMFEPKAAAYVERIASIFAAHSLGIKTWVSFEPVFSEQEVYHAIEQCSFIDFYKIGKLNYHPSTIDWAAFGRECERLCKEYGRNYYIKEDLRKEMEM
ncbi:hypothetical protein SDC9_211954 [bioreactor metagenome]|uniref:Radical SAM core domain-containing protein n=1 Tax=bioreactor metagenome TaxID=1076179 RepID=A0A645JYM2_9ZZZZ